ncbi:MAG: hypothetical protein R3E09_03225 [Novosphingobium sp.]|nr:hypothetical protein [Novosphingobium sp.]
MNLTRDRLQSIGWAFVLTVCFGLTMALTFRVNAVKSQVHLADRQIVALKREKLFLETEFEARSNQQQLTALNDIEFGYEAPKAEQYIEGERQLAGLGKPRAPDAPAPIRVASAADGDQRAPFMAMVSPITGKPTETKPASAKALAAAGPDELGDLLTRIELGEAGHE